uniref:PAX-interacting protein 1 n=1 Tax=Megaselia scalaris TaxID=36166 RepID=T1GXC5_MEGSC
AVCHVDYVLKSNWLIDSAKAGKFISPEPYTIQYIDVDDLRYDLSKVLYSQSRSTLFAGKYFFITPDVFPSSRDIEKMIKSAGGIVEPKRRSAVVIADSQARCPDTYIIITCVKDLSLIYDLIRNEKKPKCLILSTEFVMSSILTQKLEIESSKLEFYSTVNNNNNSNALNNNYNNKK